MALQTKHTNVDKATRQKVTLTSSAFGATTGQFSHASGAYAVGSDIPAGRFVADAPASLSSSSNNERMVMLPDKDGTSLFKADGVTDFSGIIATAVDGAGNFPIIGVTSFAGRTCKPKCEIGENIAVQPKGKPIGYADEQSKWNYYPIRTSVDIVTSGLISVYTEKDITPSDALFIRVKVNNAGAAVDELLGGVTNVADAGTQPAPANIRIDNGGKAGSSVTLHLGGLG